MDPATLRKAVAGDPDAQAAFLREVGPLVASLSRRLSDRDEVADDTHDVLAHLLAVLPRFKTDGAASVTTWAFTVAQRWLLMQRRKSRVDVVPLDAGLRVADAAPGPEEAARARQLSLRLDEALAQLSAEQQRAFVLTQVLQQPIEAVAAAEGVPAGTVKSRAHRAKAQLVLLMAEALDRPKGDSHAER